VERFDKSLDNIALYLSDLKYCNVLTKEEQLNLIQKYQNGDKSVLGRILESNLRLVISVVKRYTNHLVYVEFSDLIQEGNLALIKAIETYDSQKSEFSTYASFQIQKKITSFLSLNNTSIQRPEYLENLILRYKKLYVSYQNQNLALPEDSLLCELLKITPFQLNLIREELLKTTVSLDQSIAEDMLLQDVIVDENNAYENLIVQVDDVNLLLIIKELLTPMEYYVLYHRVLSETTISLEKLGLEFNTTHQNINRIEKDALSKVKNLYLDSRKKAFLKNKILQKYGSLSWLNVKPISPKDFLRYRYIEQYLSLMESKLYYMLYVERHDYPNHFIANQLEISLNDYECLLKKLNEKIIKVFSNVEDYLDFEQRSFQQLKTTVFKKTLKKEEVLDFDQIESMLHSCESDLKKETLENAFSMPMSYMSREELEYRLNSLLLNYESLELIEYHKELYNFYQSVKNSYSKEQQFVIELTIFSKHSIEDYYLNFPEGKCLKDKRDLKLSLEKMFFRIPDFRTTDLKKEDYLEIRSLDVIKENDKKILDIYFGIKEWEIKYSQSELENAQLSAINAYLGRSKKRKINKEHYIPYLNSSMLKFDDTTIEILKMFLIENLSLKDIRKEKGEFTPMKLSNLITDSLDLIDKRRFGIVNDNCFEFSQIQKFLMAGGLQEHEKNIFELKYVSNLKVEEIASKLSMSSKSVFSILTRLNKSFLSFLVQDVEINEEEISKEILLHQSESILNDEEKVLLSLFYGFKNVWNPDNMHLNLNELAQLYKVRNIKIKFQIAKCLESLKLKKCGFLKKDLCYINRDKLAVLLDDVHLPLRDEEKDIICSLFGLKDHDYKTIQELAADRHEKGPILRRKYQDAMLKIFRYVNHEINGKLSFEEDIEPNLKFFSKKDQFLLIEYYKNNKTINEIVLSYSLSESQVKYRLMKIEYQLHEILEHKPIFKLNYDKIDQIVQSEKFLFERDKFLMKKVFDLYFGQSSFNTHSFEQIIETLNLPIERTTLQKRLLEFLISICKYEYGIRRINIITEKDIIDYLNQSKVECVSQKNYDLKKLDYSILSQVMKGKHAEFIDFSSMTKEKMCEFLKEDKMQLPNSLRVELMAFFQIRNFELMDDIEKKNILNLLKSLNKKSNLGLKRSKVS